METVLQAEKTIALKMSWIVFSKMEGTVTFRRRHIFSLLAKYIFPIG